MELLDNIIWHSLIGPQRFVAQGGDRARRYPPAVSPFCAIPDEPDDDDFDALRDLVSAGGVASLFRRAVTCPPRWEVLDRMAGVQMLGPTTRSSKIASCVEVLSSEDAPAMLALAERTKPGPFLAETFTLGQFLGIFRDGELVAMAGQRANTGEHIEISAVCTDERVKGQGLATLLVDAQIAVILDAGMRPVLHAAVTNARAISLYEHLGFTHRCTIDGAIVKAPV